MKKIIFNGLSFGKDKEYFGVQRFEREILYQLDEMDSVDNIEVIVPKGSTAFSNLKNVKVVEKWIPKNKYMRLIWSVFFFPLYVKKNKGVSIDLALAYSLPVSDIVAIHDCIAERYEEVKKSKSLSKKFYFFRIKNNATKSKKIITVSEFSKNDIITFYGIDSEKIVVIPNAWQHFRRVKEDESILGKLDLNAQEYFFALGSRLKHKNDKWIIAAAQKNPEYKFVISGSTFFCNKDNGSNLPDNVLFTGYLQDSEIKALMKRCIAFIQPSIIEGFGIPPMEAMSVGTKCIVSNTSALPEVYGNSVWYINPYDYENIDLKKIMQEKTEANEKILDRFSWEKSAKMLKTVFDDLVC